MVFMKRFTQSKAQRNSNNKDDTIELNIVPSRSDYQLKENTNQFTKAKEAIHIERIRLLEDLFINEINH